MNIRIIVFMVIARLPEVPALLHKSAREQSVSAMIRSMMAASRMLPEFFTAAATAPLARRIGVLRSFATSAKSRDVELNDRFTKMSYLKERAIEIQTLLERYYEGVAWIPSVRMKEILEHEREAEFNAHHDEGVPWAEQTSDIENFEDEIAFIGQQMKDIEAWMRHFTVTEGRGEERETTVTRTAVPSTAANPEVPVTADEDITLSKAHSTERPRRPQHHPRSHPLSEEKMKLMRARVNELKRRVDQLQRRAEAEAKQAGMDVDALKHTIPAIDRQPLTTRQGHKGPEDVGDSRAERENETVARVTGQEQSQRVPGPGGVHEPPESRPPSEV